jgi:putative phosphoserine phosphatase/1-acylglycerol-3-phosphate O-acyltransferase
MDKTLISENSGSIYMRDRWERGTITAWDLAKGAGAYLQYKLGALDIQAWTVGMTRELAGQRESDLIVEGQRLFEDKILETLYPEAVALIAQHRAQGHLVAIVSGSTRYLVQPVADHLAVEDFLCTELEVVDDTLTGRCIEPLCFEEGKIYWLQEFIHAHDIDLARSWFYSDSITDLPLLDLVAHPVVTNPDPVLYRTAAKRGWPVRIFEPPTSSVNSAQ